MALTPVQQKFEELFNVPQSEYDPISPSALPARAPAPHLNLTSQIDPNAGAAAPGAEDFFAAFDGLTPQTPTDEPGYATAIGRSLKASALDAGALGLGALEYGARQTALTHESETVRDLARGARDSIASGRQSLQQGAQDIMSTLTPEQQEQAASQIFTLDPNKTIFRDDPFSVAQALGLKLARMTAPSLVSLGGAAILSRINPTAAVAWLGASEAGMTMGAVQNEIATAVEQMPEETLVAEAPRYRELLQSGADPTAARQQFIAEAQDQAPAVAGLITAAISSVAGRYLTPVFEKGGGTVIQRFGRGYAAEAPQEASQGGAEQIAANIAAKAYDEDRAAMAGVPQAMGEEGVLGGIMGGSVAAIAGRGPEPVLQALPVPEESPLDGPHQVEQLVLPGVEAGGSVVDTSGTPENLAASASRGGFLYPEEQDFLAANTNVPADGVTPATASMGERQAAGQGALELYQPGELQAIGSAYERGDAVPLPGREVATIPQSPYAPRGTQRPLPLQRRGERRRGQPPLPAVEPNVALTDVPSAEPEGDIRAQLADMQRPGSQRRGVYLSRANLSRHGTRGLEGIGVPLPNFDGQKGLMIARDQESANALNQMKQAGRPMQEILGAATGAGVGKPVDGDTAVQRRDGAGNVIQESLVREADAPALAQRWKEEFPNDEVAVLTPDEVIARRDSVLSEEGAARQGDLLAGYMPPIKSDRRPMTATRQLAQEKTREEVASKVEQAMDDELLQGERPTATTPTRAAAQLIGRGAREAGQENASRVGGFFPPKQLVFRDQGQRDRYASAFDQLVTDELTVTEIEREYKGKVRPPDVVEAYRKAHESRKATRETLKRIRTVANPTRRSEAALRAANKVEPHIGKRVRNELARTATKEPRPDEGTGFDDSTDDERTISNLTSEQVEGMHGQTLDDMFYRAARVSAGKRAYSKFTYAKGARSAAREDGSAADEVSEKIVLADQIPEGAEPVVYQLPATVHGKRAATLGAVRKTGKDRWQFVIKQEGVDRATQQEAPRRRRARAEPRRHRQARPLAEHEAQDDPSRLRPTAAA
jgi:hypothetical protein